jgi:hypothetical protein
MAPCAPPNSPNPSALVPMRTRLQCHPGVTGRACCAGSGVCEGDGTEGIGSWGYVAKVFKEIFGWHDEYVKLIRCVIGSENDLTC